MRARARVCVCVCVCVCVSVCLCLCLCLCLWERETERQTETERQRDRDRQTDRQTNKQIETNRMYSFEVVSYLFGGWMFVVVVVVVVWQHYKRNPTPANPLDPQETPTSFKVCGTLLTSFFHGSVWYSFSGLEQQSVLHLKLKRRLKHSQSIEPFTSCWFHIKDWLLTYVSSDGHHYF